METIVYTDGSCIGNPGPGGWGAIILHNNEKHILKGGEPDTTNNRMEMTAIIKALKWLQDNKISTSISLHSDSNLIVQTINSGWKRKANTDLWALMDQHLEGLNITFNWVKAHHKDKLNNEVDAIAFNEAKKF